MATRSAIGFVEYDGSVTGVYCHWDGYPEHNGMVLLEHYSDTYKLLDLLEQGDISSLRPEIGVQHPFSRFETNLTDAAYEELYGRMTTFYTRDRGEKCPAKDFSDSIAFKDHYGDCQYFYLYDGNEWTYSDRNKTGFESLPILVGA
jgi:hypothetical protein